MKFMVVVSLKPGSKNRVVEAFESAGPNRNPHIKFHGAWLAAREDAAFVLVESPSQSDVAEAAQRWSDFGQTEIHPVIDIEQY